MADPAADEKHRSFPTRPSRIHEVKLHRTCIAGVEAMTLVSNHHFPRHSHDQFGIGVIVFGTQRSWSGVGAVEASVGDVIMANPGEIHDGIPFDGRPRGWRMIYLDPALMTAQVKEEFARSVEIVHPVAQDRWLAQRFARLFGCLTDPYADQLAIDENLVSFLVSVLARHGNAQCPPLPSSPVKKAVHRLNTAPEMPVSLAELAALAGVTRFQLLRNFAKELGITPHAYLIQRRVRLARKLLANGRTPADAAAETGFADQSHMTRAFVRLVGVTPGRYQAAIS